MTKENVARLHKHFSMLAEGTFNERDFFVETSAKRPGEEAGRMSLGKMSPQRRDLIISDAKRNIAEMETKAKAVSKLTGLPRSDFAELFVEAPKAKAVSKLPGLPHGSN